MPEARHSQRSRARIAPYGVIVPRFKIDTTKSKDARYLDIHEGDELDEAQMANWVKQATALPGFLGPRP